MLVLLALLVLAQCLYSMGGQPDPSKVQQIRRQLGIPVDAKKVVIFGQTSHMDWDWLNMFSTNVNNTPPDAWPGGFWNAYVKPSDSILTHVHSMITQDPNTGYAIAEISFLRKFQEHFPQLFDELKEHNERFRMVGGGITSPENLVTHGEAFFRNYLLGIQWMNRVGLPWTRNVWIPDDFGHDSQLPIMMEAMQAKGVAFARVPGSCECGYCPFNSTTDNWHNVAHRTLISKGTGGIEFNWEAADGSSVFAYYMPTHYCPASTLRYTSAQDYTSWQDVSICRKRSPPSNPLDRVQNYIEIRKDLVSTDYMFVPAGCDFEIPLASTLMDVVTQWNTERYNTTGTYLVSSSFDYYVDLVTYSGSQLKNRTFAGTTPETQFRSNPVWMGYYASRPEIKALHYTTSRLLMAAEIYSIISQNMYNILGLSQNSWNALKVDQEIIDQLWEDAVPSTHHDYVTGTANDYVTYGEQIPLSRKCSENTNNFARKPIDAVITANARQTEVKSEDVEVYAWNSLGFSRSGSFLVEGDVSRLIAIPGLRRVQKTHDSQYLVYVDAPSIGYRSHTSTELKGPLPAGTLRVQQVADGFVMENDLLRASISKSKNWALTELFDKKLGASTLISGNVLTFKHDNGNIYRFGYEEKCGFTAINVTFTPMTASLGPLRVLIDAPIQVVNNDTLNKVATTTVYHLYYELQLNEPIIRMKLEGKAETYTSVFTNFRFKTQVESYEHGTPYHWDTKTPVPYGFEEDFKVIMEPTHNFFIPRSTAPSNNPLGAIYHSSLPTWGVIDDTVIGALLRNTPESDCASKGAAGSDDFSHLLEYSLRIPTGIESSATGMPLREALAYNTPMIAFATTKIAVHPEYSLASTSLPESALISVAKKGSLNMTDTILRIYQPSNSPTKLTLKFATDGYNNITSVVVCSAVEDRVLPSDIEWTQQVGFIDITLTALRGITTLAIKGTPSTPSPQPSPGPSPSPSPSPQPQPSPSPEPQPTPEPTPHPGPHPGPEPGPTPDKTTIILIVVIVGILVMLGVGGTLWYRRRRYQTIKADVPARYTEDYYTESESDLPIDR